MGRSVPDTLGTLFSATVEAGSVDDSAPELAFVSRGCALCVLVVARVSVCGVAAVELGTEEDAAEDGAIGAVFVAAGGIFAAVVTGCAETRVKGVAAPLEFTHCIHTA